MHSTSDIRAGDGKLLSIVLPVYNEQQVLREAYARLDSLMAVLAESGLTSELIFVDDGSTDSTPALLDGLAAQDARVRVAHLARNFGHQAAISAGLTLARGDAVAVMDADLQDPPEALPNFLAKWREGYQVVYAVRTQRKEWIGKRLAYWAFYRMMARMSDIDVPLDSGDFCLMDRSAVDLLGALPERQRFVRGLRTWIGLRQIGIECVRDARAAGKPKYTFAKLLKLAVDGLVSFSDLPLRLVTRLGIFSLFAALGLGAWVIGAMVYEWAAGITDRTPRGWASLACIVLLVSAVQMISLGIIGEYLARVFLEVKGRPTFLIVRVVGGGRTRANQPEHGSTSVHDPRNEPANIP